MSEDALLVLHRNLDRIVDRLHVRWLARKVFRFLLQRRYRSSALATGRQNGRIWKLDFSVARRGLEQEMGTVHWLRSVLGPGGCAFDIGANVGQMTLEMAQLVGASGRVVAVEPAHGNVRLLERHVEANGFRHRVDIVEAACVETDGEPVTFCIVSDDGSADALGSGHAVASAKRQSGNLVEVSVAGVSIDGLVERTRSAPRAIKIDVEGAELRVLQGARRTLETHRPAVRVAFHPFAFDDPAAASAAILSMLGGLGYRSPLPPGEPMGLAEYSFSCERPADSAAD